MSSSRAAWLIALVSALPAAAQVLACPESVVVGESIVAAGSWQSEAANATREFERISVYNGKAGGSEYDLAPDDEKKSGGLVVQTWDLKAYRTMNVFLRCRYHDTQATLWMDVPAAIKKCSLRFRIDAHGRIVGKSSMECR